MKTVLTLSKNTRFADTGSAPDVLNRKPQASQRSLRKVPVMKMFNDLRKFRASWVLPASVAITIAIALHAHAQTTYTWDGGGANNNLNTAANWVGDVAPVMGAANDLVFAGSLRLTPFNGGYPAGTGFRHITFASGAGAFNMTGDRFSIQGDIINHSTTLQTVGFLRANADQLGIIWYSGTHNINAASGDILISGNMQDINGVTTLNKTGTHTLTLSNLNPTSTTHTWDLNVQEGTVRIANVSPLGDLSYSTDRVAGQGFTVSSGATLAVGNAVTDGQLATMLGTSNFKAGSILGFDTGLGASAGNRAYTANIANTAQGQLGLLKMGANALTLSGNNTYTGNTTLQGGLLAVAGKSSLPGWNAAGRYSVGANTALAVANEFSDTDLDTMLATGNYDAAGGIGFYTEAGNRTYSKNMTGARGLAKAGANTLTLDGTNTYTGSTWISGGTLRLGSGLQSGGLAMTGTSGLDLNGNNATFTSSVASGGHTGTSGNTITDNAAGTGTSVITINNNASQTAGLGALVTDGATRKVGFSVINNAHWQQLLINANNTFSGGILVSGGAGLGSRLYLTSYTGTTDVNGVLTSSQLGIGAVTIGTSADVKGQLQIDAVGATFRNEIIFNTILGTDNLGGVRFGANNVTLAGTLYANLADVAFFNNAPPGSTHFVTGQITGDAGFQLTAAGFDQIVTLNNTGVNANDYAGNTSILRGAPNNSTLQLGANNQLPDGSGKGNVHVVGTLRLNGFSDTINGLTGSGTVHNNHASTASTLTLGAGDASGSYSGVICDGAAAVLNLTKIGSGTQTLTGTNTYTGATTVGDGTLALGATGALASTNVTVSAGATLALESGAALSEDTRLQLDGNADLNGNATVFRLWLNGELTFPGEWGSTASGANHINDTYFTGTGILNVLDGRVGTVMVVR